MSTTAARGPHRGGRCGPRPRRRKSSARSARSPRRSSPAPPRRAAPGWPAELAELNTLRAAHGEHVFLAALDRAVAFGRWRAADVRSILAAGAGAAAAPARRGRARPGPARRPGPPAGRLRDRGPVMTAAAPPPLAPDLAAGLRRLKLAAMRRLAPELLITAKTQRWAPEELLRTLVEAEITARDASNARTRLKAAAFPVTKTLEEFDRSASTIPGATLDYLASPGMDHRPRRTCAWSARPAPARATCSSPSAPPRCRPGTRSATSPPPTWPRPSTAAWPTTPSGGSSTPCSATT